MCLSCLSDLAYLTFAENRAAFPWGSEVNTSIQITNASFKKRQYTLQLLIWNFNTAVSKIRWIINFLEQILHGITSFLE
jgi:hypothetical protein